jgi:hypothetical protein
VRTLILPEKAKDRAAAQKLIQDNLANPKLFGDPLVFMPKKRSPASRRVAASRPRDRATAMNTLVQAA